MMEIGLPRLRTTWSFRHAKIYPELFPASPGAQGPVAGNHRQHFFDPTGLQSPIGSKKTFFAIRSEIVTSIIIVDGWISCELQLI